MKIYKLFTAVLSGMFLYSCTEPLNNPLEEVRISAQVGDGVTIENNLITVRRNTPVKFNIVGEPDNITFYSGESGHNYDYRNRNTIDISQIVTSKMTFKVSSDPQYGDEVSYDDVLRMYMSDHFPGLYKNDFDSDCEMLYNFEWDTWVTPDYLPTNKGQSITVELDMTPYLGKNITLAMNYEGKTLEHIQGKYIFDNMKIVNEYKNGDIIEIGAADFGFTPVNVSSINPDINQQTNLKNVPNFVGSDGNFVLSMLQYGTVDRNVDGMWNFKSINNGSFHIQGTGTEKANPGKVSLKKSWLVSDYLVINGCTPDKGTALKNITNRFESYEYTYNTVGTYKAVFVLSNANYKEEDNRIITMIINVK